MQSRVKIWKAKGTQWLRRYQYRLRSSLTRFAVVRRFVKLKPTRLTTVTKELESQYPEMRSLSEELEARFVAVSDGLEEQTTMAGKLVRQSEEMMKFVTGEHGGEECVRDTVVMLEIPLTFVEDCLTRSTQLLTRLKHHEEQLDTIRGLEVTLQNTIAPLKFIQTLYKVESATLSEDVQNVFIGLTKDIEALHMKVADVFTEHFGTLARSHETILALIERLQRHIALQSRLLKEKKATIRDSIDTLRKDLESNKDRDIVLGSTSRSIFEQSGRVVVALQFQDITRQKLQHVEVALDEVSKRLASLNEPGANVETPDSQQDLCYLKECCSLQATHLLTVLDDITKAELEINLGLEELRRRTNTLDKECVRLQSFKTMSASSDGMVQVLLDIIADVNELVNSTVKMQEEIYETVRPLGGMASNLTDTTRQLSTSIKLIALNAQVQAAQIGLGTGLEALAEGTCRISDETFEFNESTAADLDAFIWGLENIIDECAEICGQGDQQKEYLTTEGRKMTTQLHEYRDATLNAMLAVGETAAEIDRHSLELSAQLTFSKITENHVQNLFSKLQEVFEACDALLVRDAAGKTAVLTSHLKVNYTMASERAVHHEMDRGRAGALAVVNDVQGIYDPFQDDASLHEAPVFFTSHSHPPLPIPTPSPEAASPSSDSKPPQTAAPAPQPALGDNVELF